MFVGENLSQILKKIANAAEKAGRKPASVRLLAVSKMQSPQKILAAYTEGQRLFGENYVQELLPKLEQLASQNIAWHFIGSLQGKKVKSVVGKVALIHSVDRLSLAQEISKRSVEKKCVQPVLLQVNIGDEASKSGVAVGEFLALVKRVVGLPAIRVEGLMVMPPLSLRAEESRRYFQQTRELLDSARHSLSAEILAEHPFTELSMGTSADFEAAIAEGATMVRIGSDIFGMREESAKGDL